jgi:periplasmic protein TonB
MMPQRRTRRWPFVASAALHASALVALAFLSRLSPPPAVAPHPAAPASEERWITHLVFVPSSAVAGGGGGGGNRQPGPIRRQQGRGNDAATVRVAKPIVPAVSLFSENLSLPGLLLDARPLASGRVDQMGLPEGGVPYGSSTGPGSGGGVGAGTGSGIGDGEGPGIGPGRGGGIGGGVYRAGGGVSSPTLVKEVRPSYPPDALSARIQGSVVLELIVTSEGLPSDIRVVRSLASDLDTAAVRAVQEWRFRPGRLGQTPVNVRVTVILDFSVH